VPYPTHDTRQDATPNKKKKKKKKIETVSPTPKERKQARKMRWQLEEELVKLFVCRCYLQKTNSFISPYKFGFVGDRKCVAAKKKEKKEKNTQSRT
jgi:hypothetical protein